MTGSADEKSDEPSLYLADLVVELTDDDIVRSELLRRKSPDDSVTLSFPFEQEDFHKWRTFKLGMELNAGEYASVLQVC